MFQQAFVHNRTELFHLIDSPFSQVCQQKQPPEVFNEKKVFLKISQNSQEKLIEITLRHGCSPVNLLHIFRTAFP